MNTAARIESNGFKNRIHVSAETAELLCRAGKSHWVTPRRDKIEAKGKGLLQTYWVLNKGARSVGASSTGSSSMGTGKVRDTFFTDFEPTKEEIEENIEQEERPSLVSNLIVENEDFDFGEEGTDEADDASPDQSNSHDHGVTGNDKHEEKEAADPIHPEPQDNIPDDEETNAYITTATIPCTPPPVQYSSFLKKSSSSFPARGSD